MASASNTSPPLSPPSMLGPRSPSWGCPTPSPWRACGWVSAAARTRHPSTNSSTSMREQPFQGAAWRHSHSNTSVAKDHRHAQAKLLLLLLLLLLLCCRHITDATAAVAAEQLLLNSCCCEAAVCACSDKQQAMKSCRCRRCYFHNKPAAETALK